MRSSWTPEPPEEDVLPPYAPSVQHSGDVMVKREMLSPFERCRSRSWHRQTLEINSTQLIVHEAAGGARQQRIYTLQYAEAGLAIDYTKRPFVIRLRVEGEQMLLAFPAMAPLVHWLVLLQAAIGLSLPIEQRCIPDVARNHRHYHGTDAARQLNCCEVEKCKSVSSTSAESVHSANSSSSTEPFSMLKETRRYDFREFERLKRSEPWDGKRFIFNGKLAEVIDRTLRIVVA